jgi:hypothetical protein
MKKENRNLYTDKVQITVGTLIEIKRAFGALIDDKESYLHKVFSDDYAFHAIDELKKVYGKYFEEEQKAWGSNKPTPTIIPTKEELEMLLKMRNDLKRDIV